MSSTCFETEVSSSGRTLYIYTYIYICVCVCVCAHASPNLYIYMCVCVCVYVRMHHQTCIYRRLPEDEPSRSKHVEDIKNVKKLKYLENAHFAGLYCVIPFYV